jgi:class 3 adenylate cyclase/YHS domain-containing protein
LSARPTRRPSRLPPPDHVEPIVRKGRPKLPVPSTRIVATFGFIDLAGFTALTEEQGDFDAADVATRFADLTRVALGKRDRLVKTIGDAVLITSPDPGAALDLVDRILTAAADEPSLPALRAGLHHGPAIERHGDVFGAAVNLAARVAAEAYAGEVLATAEIAEVAAERGIPVAEIGAVPLKNVSVAPMISSLGFMVGATESAVDPVCQAVIDRRASAGELRHDRQVYWFCSLTCAAAFASNPEWHVGPRSTAKR